MVPVSRYALGLLLMWSAAWPQGAQPKTTVVLYLIDGLQPDAALTAAHSGAENLKLIFDQGVWAEKSYCTSPAPRLRLPDKSEPWGTTSSPNVSVHTGCHLFESREMDDIFLAARDAGIKSVYAGGASNYKVFNTPDFHYAGNLSDEEVVKRGIEHFRDDGARLIRLHPQRIRDDWDGPADKSDPNSGYIEAIRNADDLLGQLIQVLKDGGVWDSTYLIVAADHGMGETSSSDHPPPVISSWIPFIGFYGPGIKKGESIPYAETPDLGILTAHVLGLRKLRGHTDPDAGIEPKGPTGTLLENIFEGRPREQGHPRLIERYLEASDMRPGGDYAHYHNGMVDLIKELPATSRRAGLDQRPGIRVARNGSILSIRSAALFDGIEIAGMDGRILRSLNLPARVLVHDEEFTRLPAGGVLRLMRGGEMVEKRALPASL